MKQIGAVHMSVADCSMLLSPRWRAVLYGWHSVPDRIHVQLHDCGELADYSFVMPAGAFGYALTPLVAILVLHETVAPKRWLGVALICVGLCSLARLKRTRRNTVGDAVIKFVVMLIVLVCCTTAAKSPSPTDKACGRGGQLSSEA